MRESTRKHHLRSTSSRLLAVGVLIALTVTPSAQGGAARVLLDHAWQEDLKELATAIQEVHVDPFHKVSRADFRDAVTDLNKRLGDLSDKEIVVEMARIVALIGDGHTRLFIPREHPNLAPRLERGHRGTPAPRYPELRFAQLPIRIGIFDDGVFIFATAPWLEHLLGARVKRIGRLSVDEALDRAKAVVFGDNEMSQQHLLADRIVLPEVLAALGISESPSATTIVARLKGTENDERIRLEPLSAGAPEWVELPAERPRWLRNTEDPFWYEPLPDRSAMHVQLNTIASSGEQPLSEFLADSLAKADEIGASRYVLDLRWNHGGDGMWNTAVVSALTMSRFNEFGRLFVLTGRGTFSAAQMLANQLERYLYVVFVGEPTGASPSHYGDARRIILGNSGLTLRVATRYWPSWLAGEVRDATAPHVDAPIISSDYFQGHDTALEAALAWEPPSGVVSQMEDLLRQDKVQHAALLFVRFMADYRIPDHDVSDEITVAGQRLLDESLLEAGYYLFALAAQQFSHEAGIQSGLARALELKGDIENARLHYERAIELNSTDPVAREALARLSSGSLR